MTKTLFLAGATGAIGRRLAPQLVADGWHVVGSTRASDRADALRLLGVEPVIVDVFDAPALTAAICEAKPDIIIHQLTDLPAGLDPAKMVEATQRNARIRSEGTRNLVEAGIRAGVRRFIAQSVAFAYADGPTPHAESDALAVRAEGRAGVSARGVAILESLVMAAPFEGLVLRYGRLYGPGTGFDAPDFPAPVHVDAAARAAALAVVHGGPGIYNVAEDDGTVDSNKAKHQWQWSAAWRLPT